MRYLLDTHTLLWFLAGDPNLSQKASIAITDELSERFVSIATFWEIGIKVSLGKLKILGPLDDMASHIIENGFDILSIGLADTLTISKLPLHHRDPFDRMIIAQALSHNMTIITKDESFKEYGVDVLW